jgi:predicted NUDIX family NTP pyrophosphohydrolase
MPKTSAGLLLFRDTPEGLQVLLAHPGGPLWAKRDDGAWTIPKGEIDGGEDPLSAARREFEEEMGQAVDGDFIPLGEITQAGGKRVVAWAVRAEFEPASLRSNLFSMEWPPRSGRQQQFPEVDRAQWFDTATARRKLLPSQLPLLEQLEQAGTAGTLNRDTQG